MLRVGAFESHQTRMQYEFFSWAMLAVVAAASVGGLLLGRLHSLRLAVIGCIGVSLLIAVALSAFVSRLGLIDAALLSGIAGFLFSVVISFAFALLIRRIVLRGTAT